MHDPIVGLAAIVAMSVVTVTWFKLNAWREKRRNALDLSPQALARHRQCLQDEEREDEREGGFFQEVAGESHYQPALRVAAARATGERRVVPVVLEPDDANDFDANAVAVKVFGRLVGYLPRPDAKRYRKRFGQSSFECRGSLVGGEAGKYLGIWLDLELSVRRSRSSVESKTPQD